MHYVVFRHCVRCVHICSYFDPYFLHIQSKCGKIWTSKTPNTEWEDSKFNWLENKDYNVLISTCNLKKTYSRYKNVIIVSASPAIDIPHPTHVMVESASDVYLVCDTSSNKAKFVKWLHSQVIKPLYFCVSFTLHPWADHEPITPGIEVAKYVFRK